MSGPAARTAARLRPATLLLALLVVSTAWGQSGELGDEQTLMVMSLEELEAEIARREADLARYTERLESLERQNEQVRQRLERRAEELRLRELTLRGRVVTLCRLSRGGFVQLLRGAPTVAALIRRAQIASTVVDRDIAVLEEHQRRVEELEQEQTQLDQRLAAQRDLQQRIARYRTELEAERQRRLERRSMGGGDPFGLDDAAPSPFPY